MTMIKESVAVIDRANSFLTSPYYLQTGEEFDNIIKLCGFPETVSITYIKLLNSWITGNLYDAVFLDFVSWHVPSLVSVTKCLIASYSGGLI